MKKMSLVILLIIFLFASPSVFAVLSPVICPDHGVNSTWTGNKKFSNKHTYCEYEHPWRTTENRNGKVIVVPTIHKFWSECD